MQTVTPKTTDQLRAIFGLGRERGHDKESLMEMAGKRLSELSFDEANGLIVQLGGEAFGSPPAGGGVAGLAGRGGGSGHVAKRTENYRKQKANVKTLVTAKQLRLMKDLADKRNMSQIGLASLCMRIIKRSAPQTTAQCNKVIEALKSMNARDRVKEAA